MASSSRGRGRPPMQAGDADLPPLDNDVPAPNLRQNDYRFEVQFLFEIQKSIGELKSTQESMRDSIKANHDVLKSSIDGTKTKVEDLVALKNKLIGGAAVLAVITSLAGFIIGKASDYIQIKAPNGASNIPTAPAPVAAPAPSPSAPPTTAPKL